MLSADQEFAVNLNTVCALLCEAIFYEASSLQEVCMQYMACNIETMLEQRLLDLLPAHALDRLAAFCRKRQLDRLPRTARSGKAYRELREKYPDFVKELDIPKPTGGYRRYTRNSNFTIRSPKLSPAQFSASLRLSPNMLPPPTAAMSPTRVPPSPALSALSVTSPVVRPSNGDDGETFEMEDLQLDEPVPTQSQLQLIDPLRPVLGAARVQVLQALPWRRPTGLAAPSFQEIMAQENQTPPKVAYTPPRRTSESHSSTRQMENSPVSPAHKLTQKERKRQQASSQSDTIVASASSAEKASSPWRPILPGVWKPPQVDQEKPSLADIQAHQKQVPGSTSMPRTVSGRATPDASSPLNRRNPSGQAGKGGEPTSQGRDVNAANAPVITPVRLQPKRDVSSYNRPPETRSHDTPWVNYVSTVSVVPTPDSQTGTSQSFATIQNLQDTEKDAIRKARGPMR